MPTTILTCSPFAPVLTHDRQRQTGAHAHTQPIALTPVPRLVGPGQDGRLAVESCIARRFAEHYGARITEFMPWLLVLEAEDGMLGAMGLRPALAQRLFIEDYLDAPIEDVLGSATAARAPRGRIVEIGNLASVQPGSSSLLFAAAAELLWTCGYRHAVFNATRTVQSVLRKMDFPFVALREADPARLGDRARGWGSYYATPSTVIAVSLADTHRALHAPSAPAAQLAGLLGQARALAAGMPEAEG